MLVDVHCHLDFPQFEKDLGEVIKRSEDKGFVALVNNGVHLQSNKKILEISKKYKIVKPAFGLYPEHAVESTDKEIEEIINFIKKNKPIAIGEIGIDYFRVKNPEKQIKVFKRFIELAKELDIPAIVHSRKAEQDTIEILEELKPKKLVLHCFSGTKELTEKAIKNGWMFSIPTSLSKNKTFKKLTKRIPLDRMLTETDSPYLSPFEGKRNEPPFILESIKRIAELREIPEEELKKTIFSNYKKMFSI